MDAIIWTLLDQIRWQRSRDGSYSHDDPLLLTQEKLRKIRDGKEQADILDKTDLAMLKQSLVNSIRKIDGYDYKMDAIESARQRSESLAPLLAAMEWINLKGG
jgi:hypothetical protein